MASSLSYYGPTTQQDDIYGLAAQQLSIQRSVDPQTALLFALHGYMDARLVPPTRYDYKKEECRRKDVCNQ
ncbi:hypothetical protein PtrSN002B_001660 [Pyrenophora tritici-repentis]|nr:hypothetical protein PtrV1_04854 [Pyrenophora tritici-repentis]KAI0585084.1 hypothetical protein Alg130_04924 [Pyrenophora tritici-repentis]KAI0610849.1 hypothetical protein TUN205_04888 [Pyrenophora tritici-repentis]KAI0622931.1 hypothetical protein TUN199_05086 [Pyrenophora tritici-repentis]KAI1540950.1 hypothetical protein PtrSN001A_004039 [Pyrenophora tritici-repentis]